MLTRFFLVTALCLSVSGCATFTTDKDKSSKSKSWFPWSKKEYQVPQSMAVIWAEDILSMPGHPVTRGFGGRIYFYNEKSQAIPVEGELVVHGFDESSREKNPNAKPAADKRFRFTSEQFTQHFAESQLGASYNVWIPWDAGGPQKKITLIPTFISNGKMIRGEASKITLAGVAVPGMEFPGTDSMAPNTIQQISHSEPTVSGPLPRMTTSQGPADSMRTTTIQVPTDTTRRTMMSTSSQMPRGGELPTSVSYGGNLGTLPPALANSNQAGAGSLTPQQLALVQSIQQNMTRNAMQTASFGNTGMDNGSTAVGTAANLSNLQGNMVQGMLNQIPNQFPNQFPNQVVPASSTQPFQAPGGFASAPITGASQAMVAAPMNPPNAGQSHAYPSQGIPPMTSLPGVAIPPMVNLQPNMQSFPSQANAFR